MTDPSDREVVVFSAARRLPAGQRAAYLDKTCAGDGALRQRVEELLRAGEEAAGFLQNPAPGSQRPADAVATARTLQIVAAPGEKAGDRIGHYKLLQPIGEGGCGVVYMAEQEEPVRRRVALKVIKLGMDTKSVIARFEAERQALALMDHPNIAKVLEAGATETGRPYFVMELVRGIKITDYCDENNLSTNERLELFIQVCHAVQHAHQKGVIHRDLKPSNILVASNDGVPVPKVIDFGIAKATQGRLTDQTLFTAFEQFIGTPAYMSPEQAELTMFDVDTRTDIYSLGVLLYELLTGRTPFDGNDLLAAGLDAMRRTIREQEPQRPSARLSTMAAEVLTTTAHHRQTDSPKLIHLLRGDLDWIVMKALEKDRARRYETANGLAVDIQRHLTNEPVVARPPSNLYRFQKLVQRNKLVFAASTAAAASLVIGLGIATWSFVGEKEARQIAVTSQKEEIRLRQEADGERRRAETEASKSHQVALFLEDMLQSVGPKIALGRDTKLLREIVDQTAQRLDKDLKDHPAVEAQLRATLGNLYSDLGEYTNAAAMHRKALQLRMKLLGRDNRDTAASLNELGEALRRQGRHTDAEPLLREALAIRRQLLGSEHVDVASSLDSLGMLVYYDSRVRARAGEGEALLREALDMRRQLLGDDHLDVANSLDHLGVALTSRGKFAEGEELHREALALRRKLYGDAHPDIAASLHQVAWSLMWQGKLADAEATFREALAMRRKLLGSNNLNVATTLLNLGTTLDLEKKYAGSKTAYREALDIYSKSFGEDHPSVVSPLASLAGALWHEGELTQAEAYYRQALAINTDSYGNWHPPVASLLNNLAGVLRDEGKVGEAEAAVREVERLELFKREQVDRKAETATKAPIKPP